MAKKKIKYTLNHQYHVNDLVEYKWLSFLKLGTIIKLTITHEGNYNVATYLIKDIHNNTKHPNIGHNNEMEFGNIIKKIIN